MTDQFTIKAIDENNPPEFWAAMDELFPEIADLVREGDATVDPGTWDAIQRLEGFDEGPVYALESDVEETENENIDGDGIYQVVSIASGGFAVVNGETGQVFAESNDREDAINTAEKLNQGDQPLAE